MRAPLSFAPGRGARVLIADDHPQMLRAVAAALSPHFEVVAAVRDGDEALQEAERTSPELVVLDISMPKLDGFGTARELARRKSAGRIIFLTGQEDDDCVREALSLGAQGYVTKRRLHSDLVPSLNLAIGGHLFISPYAFVGSLECKTCKHVLQFYEDELVYFQGVGEVICSALDRGELVFVLLSEIGRRYVTRLLRTRGLDCMSAIHRSHFWVIGIENSLLLDLEHPWRSDSLFYSCLKRAISCSQESGRKLTIVSDAVGASSGKKWGCEAAARLEMVWNNAIAETSCTVYCGCPIRQLGAKGAREVLSRICREHANVTAINSPTSSS